jgi:DNA-binding winged helix-turn-helix (wHTH) protein/tetratricopeptide (TPR) repeat protein
VKLAPQPYKLLVLLVSKAGRLVKRHELCQAIWGSDTTVDFEHGLNTCMRQVRAALNDEADAPRIIETVPRVGYRLLASVTQDQQREDRIGRTVRVSAAIAVMVTALGVTVAYLTPSSPKTSPIQRDAHALYVRGLVRLDSRTEADTFAARELFTEAAKRDPVSAEAQAGLARTYLTKPKGLAGVGPTVARSRAEAAIQRARTLDPSAPEVERALADLKLATGDWSAAERAFLRNIERTPGDASAHEAYAEALALRGRFDQALHEAQRALELDPFSPTAGVTRADILRFAPRYDEGIVAAQDVLRNHPTYGPAFHTLGLCYQAKGELDRAIESYRRSGRRTGNLGHAYAIAGHTQEARLLLRELEQRYQDSGTGAGGIAQIHVGLRQYDQAFGWLQRMVDEGGPTTLKVADVWDPLRPDPRFHILLDRLGLNE